MNTDYDDYAHCVDCDRVINLDKDFWEILYFKTYCKNCIK